MMKKAAIIILSATTIFFLVMWLQTMTKYVEEEYVLCQRYAEDAAGSLSNYKDIIEDGQYRHSVAVFYAFIDTLYMLPDDGGWNKAMYDHCKVRYDHMVLAPDEVLAHLDEVLATLELVGEDFTSSEARSAMSELSYNLQYVWE